MCIGRLLKDPRGYCDEASADFGLVKEKVHELTQQLELSTESKELLMVRLQTALDEIRCLNEYKMLAIQSCNDLTLKNQNYEEICRMLLEEHAPVLPRTLMEWEELKAVRTDFDELTSVKESLQNIVNASESKLWNLLASYDKKYKGLSLFSEYNCQDLESKDLTGVVLQIEELQQNVYEIVQLMEEKKDLAQERDIAQASLRGTESDNLIMKQKFEQDLRGMMDKLDVSHALVQKLQLQVGAIANKLEISLEVEEKYAQQHKELLSDLDHLEMDLQQISSKYQDLVEEIMALETVTDELGRCKLAIAALSEEKEALVVSLQDKMEESFKLSMEDSQLLDFDQQKDELVHLKQLLSESELEKSRVSGLLLDSEDCLKDAREECSSISALEAQLSEMHELSIAADVGFTFTKTQYETRVEELDQKLHFSDSCLSALRNNHLHVENMLNRCLASERHLVEENTKLMASLKDAGEECSFISVLEAQLSEMHEFSVAADVELTFTKAQYEARTEELSQILHFSDSHLSELRQNHLLVENMLNECLASESHYIEENTKLMTSLSSLTSELEASIAQNRILLDTNSTMRTELEEYKKRAEHVEAIVHVDKSQRALEIEKLEHILVTSEEDIDNLIFSKEELEIKFLVFKAKLDEQCTQIASLEAYKGELTMMHNNECNELKQRLAEQVLKAEEFKNLSIHFKELKDKSCVECLHAHEKREPEAPPTAMQESLRIAFIKEQYETKLQELKQQLSMSKKHCEEMLWKLQDAIDEVEKRKKSEATNVKRNEELGMRILELESELHLLLSEKREIMKAYDLMKAEKECSLISLDCCKEEKQELQASLQKCNEEKGSQRDLTSGEAAGHECLNSIDEADKSDLFSTIQPKKVDIVSRGVNGISSVLPSKQKDVLNSDMKHLVLANEHFRAQSLRSSMDNLNKELEKMKHENASSPR
ncbi:hypothetical protein M0R45_027645 [Rubus argutus]|uniref:Uncharacterized protein n=1 Tax=Rubus argutus TaxID=59490 RepID=A0AAW1X3L4_RUBAR